MYYIYVKKLDSVIRTVFVYCEGRSIVVRRMGAGVFCKHSQPYNMSFRASFK